MSDGRRRLVRETHVQKAMYLMQELLEVPTEYSFILYKHGPFSFDLSDELTSFRGDYLLELAPRRPPMAHALPSRTWANSASRNGPRRSRSMTGKFVLSRTQLARKPSANSND